MDQELTGIDKVLEAISRRSGRGSEKSSLSDILRAQSIRGVGGLVQSNQDHQGYTFFTKPMCNLDRSNVLSSRKLAYLADTGETSIGSAIKTYLTTYKLNVLNGDTSSSKLVDNDYAFIPLLGNTVRSLTGWPDHIVDFSTSDPGVAKEVYSWADSRPEFYGEFDLNASFFNIDGDLVTTLLSALYQYMGEVAYGSMVPWRQVRAANVMDYQFRIYRLITDKSKRKLLKIACTGASMLGTPADGAAFNYTTESVFAADNAEVSVQIKCNGVRYADPIVIDDFNRTVAFHNQSMAKDKLDAIRANRSGGEMVRLETEEEHLLCNNHAYPHITDDNVIEWWCKTNDYITLMNLQGLTYEF